MATNPMQRKARNSFILGMLVMLVICGVIIAFLFIQITNLNKKEQENKQASVKVYVLSQDVGSGQVITTDMFTMQTVNKNRPNPHNVQERLAVENEDQATALVRFDNGCMGTIETSRIACGRKMGLSYVITGTKGSISYTQERMAELKLYLHDEDPARQGFKTILTGPLHPDYKNFCVSAGHGIGFNDQKTVEIRDLVNGLASPEGVLYPDFEEGYKVSRVLDAIALSYHQKRWVNVEEIA